VNLSHNDKIRNMNKLGIIAGIVSAVIISGAMVAYAGYQADLSVPTNNEIKNSVSNMEEDIDNVDIGYGQVEKSEGAYSP
jgi:hypothetical protein